MNTVTRLGWILAVTSLLAAPLAHGDPQLHRESGKAYCAHKAYCARTSNSRIMFVDPRPADIDSKPGFNLIDGEPFH